MCGILGIISLNNNSSSGELITASAIIKHRGPDDEGFLTLSEKGDCVIWSGQDTAVSTQEYWGYQQLQPGKQFKIGLAHRRLSIVDLSPAGHQPMVYKAAGLAISFNGEIYNYIEIKDELERLGHQFISKTDTEVILHAWAEWGEACLEKFNGMFAFIIVDNNKKELFAVRDRLGVRPLYYYQNDDNIVLASEIKQIRSINGFRPSVNEKIIADFLAQGLVDHTSETFDNNIKQVPQGHFVHVNFGSPSSSFKIIQWYSLIPQRWGGSWDDAVIHFKELLIDAVQLRLRADVAIGSCLSGGLDSSSIVCIAAKLLKEKGDFVGQETVTACFDNPRYDEWKFAEAVVKKANTKAHRVFTGFNDLVNDFDAFTWHQDEPTASTSTFSQWAVFKKTHEVGLKVMIDGQGADEQLAGYSGNDISLYAGYLKTFRLNRLYKEIAAYKGKNNRLPLSFLLGATQILLGPTWSKAMPAKWRVDNSVQDVNWLENYYHKDLPGKDLRNNLLKQVNIAPLPGFLRYEDRNSMAWSIESRTPFMDYRLFEFALGLPEDFVYETGVTKKILRESMKDILPVEVSGRRDKMGFVTPEELWLKNEGKKWFTEKINETVSLLPSFINGQLLKKGTKDIIDGKLPFNFLPWRTIVLGNWLKCNKI